MSIVTLNDRAVRSVTAFGSLNTGSMVFIKKLTASSSSTLSFVDGTSDGSEEHTSELQSRLHLVCRLLLEKKKKKKLQHINICIIDTIIY